GGYRVGPLYNVNPNVFGQSNGLIEPVTKVGDDTRTFNGVDVTFNVRAAHGFTFSGGTGTGEVVNDWCAIRAAVPENFLLNPYCHVESPVLTSFNGLAAYAVPKIDVLISGVYHDRPLLNGTPNNASTDQLGGSLQANYTLTAADIAAAAQQIGRPLTRSTFTVNLIEPGTLYGARNRELDLTFKKILRLGAQRLTAGLDIYNVTNSNTTLFYNATFVANVNGWQTPLAYMNPRVFRLNAELAW